MCSAAEAVGFDRIGFGHWPTSEPFETASVQLLASRDLPTQLSLICG